MKRFIYIALLFALLISPPVFADSITLQWDETEEIELFYYMKDQLGSWKPGYSSLNPLDVSHVLLPSSKVVTTGYVYPSTLSSSDVIIASSTDIPQGYAVGYNLYYKSGGSGEPYEGTGLDQGDSPIDVGHILEYTLTGLSTGVQYCFVVTAYTNDDTPIESEYSNEVCDTLESDSNTHLYIGTGTSGKAAGGTSSVWQGVQ